MGHDIIYWCPEEKWNSCYDSRDVRINLLSSLVITYWCFVIHSPILSRHTRLALSQTCSVWPLADCQSHGWKSCVWPFTQTSVSALSLENVLCYIICSKTLYFVGILNPFAFFPNPKGSLVCCAWLNNDIWKLSKDSGNSRSGPERGETAAELKYMDLYSKI